MKKTLCLLLAVLFTVTAAAALVGVTVAWLTDGLYAQRFPDDFSGSSDLAYFAGGDGTANNPYEISTPVHLYNLAWLQYLGYFNRKDGLNNDLDQTYFKLTDNVSMASFNSALPPIGTEEYPFIGHFDGNGYTVSNVTVSNTGTGKNALTIHPTAAVFDESGILRTAGNTAAVSIVGLFGVIGNPKGTTYVDTYAAANPDFVKDTMTVGGFYANDLHIRSYTENTLCGLIAGWVGANLSHVGVYRGDFVFDTNAAGLAAFLDDGDSGTLLSKYSLVGNYDKDLVGWSALTGSGDNTDWGGSIDMKNVFTRADTFYNSVGRSEYDPATFEVKTGTGKYRYIHDEQGTFYYGQYKNNTTGAQEGIIFLIGGKYSSNDIVASDPAEGEIPFYIHQGEKYLTIPTSGTSVVAVAREKAVTWFFSEEGYLYAYKDATKYYLNKGQWGITVAVSTSPVTVWTHPEFGTESDISSVISCAFSGSDYYLTLSGNYWRAVTTEATNTLTKSEKSMGLYNGYLYEGANGSWTTHFPLNTYDADGDGYSQYGVSPKNTGYIISGCNNSDGDIRLYRTTLASLGNAITGGTYGAGSTMKIYTRTAATNGFTSFSDVYGSDTNGSALGLVKYASSKTGGFDALLGEDNLIYGMHFMSAAISADKIMTAPYASILGKEYTNYQMPADSINFRVQSRGYINFFAGTYYSGGSDNFFSLHQVFRNDDESIAFIKEIDKIFTKAGSNTYIYLYKDGTYSEVADTAALTLAFDCDWIANPGDLTSSAVYYMEIPVNAGEYALGSASTGNGAYLMYLDIGANAAGTGETPGGGTAYAMESVDFVNRAETGVERDGNGIAIKSSFDSYTAVVAALSDANGTPYIVFRRRDGTATDASGNISTVLAYRAAGLTVAPTPQTAAEEDTTLSPPDDIGTA